MFGRYGFGDHAAVHDPYVRVEGLSFPDPADTMLLMTGHEPMAYLIPSLPPAIPVLRIDGWLAQPDDGSGLTASMRARVAAHRGDLFLLAAPDERTAADRRHHVRMGLKSSQRNAVRSAAISAGHTSCARCGGAHISPSDL